MAIKPVPVATFSVFGHCDQLTVTFARCNVDQHQSQFPTSSSGTHCSVVVKAVCCKPEDRGLENR
jgi:hypothetical protein